MHLLDFFQDHVLYVVFFFLLKQCFSSRNCNNLHPKFSGNLAEKLAHLGAIQVHIISLYVYKMSALHTIAKPTPEKHNNLIRKVSPKHYFQTDLSNLYLIKVYFLSVQLLLRAISASTLTELKILKRFALLIPWRDGYKKSQYDALDLGS